MRNRLPFDELNAFESGVELSAYRKSDGGNAFLLSDEDIIDEMLDLFLLCIANAVNESNDALGGSYAVDEDYASSLIYRKVAGKDFQERVREYAETGDSAGIRLVAETETHRIYETAAYDAAKANGATKKTWETMMDDRVRDAHWMLQGVTVGIDELFGIDGVTADMPGHFGVAEQDCNCRCWCSYSK